MSFDVIIIVVIILYRLYAPYLQLYKYLKQTKFLGYILLQLFCVVIVVVILCRLYAPYLQLYKYLKQSMFLEYILLQLFCVVIIVIIYIVTFIQVCETKMIKQSLWVLMAYCRLLSLFP